MAPNRMLAIIFPVLLTFVGLISAFTVNEGEGALVLRLGKMITDTTGQPEVLQPGLHFRIPLVDDVKIFDLRMQGLTSSATIPLTVVTKEHTYLVVEYFAKWHINDLAKFYTSNGGSVSWSETLLQQHLNDIVRAKYGQYTSDQAISADRANMLEEIRQEVDNIGKDQGINVVDVRIQQITLPKENAWQPSVSKN